MLITIVFYVHRYLLLWTFWPLNYIWNLKSIFPQAFKDNASSSGGELTMNILITNSYRSSTNVDHQLIFMFIPFFHPTILKATAEAISVCGTGHQSDPALAKCPTNKLPHSHSWQLLMTVFTTFVDDNTYDNCQVPNFLIHVDDNCYESWWSHFIHFVIFFSWKFQVLTLVAQCANRLFLPLPTGGVGVVGGCGGVGWWVLHYMARKQLAISKIMTQLFHHLAFVLRSIYARTMRCFDVSLVTFSHYIAGPKGCKGNQVLTSEISIFFLFVFQLLLLFIWLFIFRFSNPYIKVIEQ